MHHKIKIITGKDESGKTFLAKNIMLGFEKPLFINGRNKGLLHSNFLFTDVEHSTDLIVIDDVAKENVIHLIFLCYGNIIVDKRGYSPEQILAPQVIITTTNFSLDNLDASTKRRIDVIETNIEITESGNKIFNSKRI